MLSRTRRWLTTGAATNTGKGHLSLLGNYLAEAGALADQSEAAKAARKAQSANAAHPTQPNASTSAFGELLGAAQGIPAAPPVEDPLLGYFARLIMKHGKLLTARKHTATMLNTLRSITNDDPLPLFRRAVQRAAPSLKIVSKKLTATKRVDLPLPLSEKARVRRGILAMVAASDKRVKSETVFGKRLAMEVLSVLDGSSDALTKKQQTHRAATLARSNVAGARTGPRIN